MKAAVVFLSGLAAMLAGASIRSCAGGFPPEFAQSWCGNAPASLVAASHVHCAGCVLLAAGLALIAGTPLLARFASPLAASRVLW